MWYMHPVRVSTDVPNPAEEVYDFLDVMANHEPFTDHMLQDWRYSGPDRGIGSKARVTVKAAGRSETVDIEVIAGERPHSIVERNVGAGGRRIATGTYTLESLPDGGTRIVFEYAWKQAPLRERIHGGAAAIRRVVPGIAGPRDDAGFSGVERPEDERSCERAPPARPTPRRSSPWSRSSAWRRGIPRRNQSPRTGCGCCRARAKAQLSRLVAQPAFAWSRSLASGG